MMSMTEEKLPPPVDAARLREVLGQYPTGVCVVTAIGPDGQPVGLTVGSFGSVSLDPPLVAFMPDKRSSSWPKIRPAGVFCVNVLSMEQEPLCRSFASKAPDKFAQVEWTSAPSGSPAIAGASAWIDCDLERVDDAGDHEIVLGRVRDLESRPEALPLLFFRGGYGRFGPMSMVANDAYLSEQLRVVDAVRGEMDIAARDLGGQVVAWSVVGDALVLVASAGELAAGTTWSTVGERVPLIPPVGSAIMAWQDADRIDEWLGRVGDPAIRDMYRARLDGARERGYSVLLDTPNVTDVMRLIDERRLPGEVEALGKEQREALASLPSDPLHFSPAEARKVRAIFLPVKGRDGSTLIALGIRLSRTLSGPADLRHHVERIRDVTERVSRSLTTS
jgi:flavin reductase (DIM6/NTAB) family NADH-FMN oxidoreductase RutF/DNA-binding IclR family transcriptional regulator